MTGCAAQLPERLLQNGRPTVEPLPREGVLFRRLLYDQVTNDGNVTTVAFRYPNFSVNASQFSEATDVLLPIYLDFGIAELQFDHVPPAVKHQSGPAIQVEVRHVPLQANYAHCQIEANEGEVKLQGSENLAWKEARARMANAAVVVKMPDESAKLWSSVKQERTQYWNSLCEQNGWPDWMKVSPTSG